MDNKQAGKVALLPGGVSVSEDNYYLAPFLQDCSAKLCHHHANKYNDVVQCKLCSNSFCYSCWYRYYREMLQLHEISVCPKCLGICSCKHCLRKEVNFE